MADLTQPRGTLALISTHWPMISDPGKFVLRYAPAIREYLQLLLPPAEVEEVLQEFLFSVLNRGFKPERARSGKFRHYLIATIRYRAWRYLRRKKIQPLSDKQADSLQANADSATAEAEWLAGWRQCLLDRAWAAIEFKQRQTPGNWHYTVLKLTRDQPEADSKTLATQVPANPLLTATAFRKQLSRARAAFARALIDDVERTIEKPTPEAVMEELAEIGLLEYVRPYLKADELRK